MKAHEAVVVSRDFEDLYAKWTDEVAARFNAYMADHGLAFKEVTVEGRWYYCVFEDGSCTDEEMLEAWDSIDDALEWKAG